MNIRTKYTIVGIVLIAVDICLVLLGGWLNMPALQDLPRTFPERAFDGTLAVFTVATVIWWAPASLLGIASAILAEHYHVSIGLALIPTVVLLCFQPRLGGWLWTTISNRIIK